MKFTPFDNDRLSASLLL